MRTLDQIYYDINKEEEMKPATEAWLKHILSDEESLTGYSLSLQGARWEITLNFGENTKMIRGTYRSEIREELNRTVEEMRV